MTSAVDDVTGEAQAPPERRRRRESLVAWAWSLVRLDFVGVAFGALFFCLSLTPSLLPRDWVNGGVIGGINAAIGYGVGVLAGKLFRRLFLSHRVWWPPGPKALYGLKAATVVVSIGASVLMLVPAAAWQRQLSAVMGIEGPGTLGYLRTLAVALVTGGLLVGVARVIKDAIKFLARVMIRRWDVNDEVAMFVGTAIVVVLIIMLVNGVLVRGFIAGARTVFQPQNASTRPGIEQPVEPERSGSPGSFARWDTLGFQGRNFVATGPHAAELTQLNGRPAKEPIRAYAGLGAADDIRQSAEMAARELERTGGLNRKVVAVGTTTGTGWINEAESSALEYMYNGDTAIVSMQYSFLPSWISFLVDKENARAAGQALFEAVDERVRAMPEAKRPKLVVFGESLGSFGGEAPFLSLNNLVARTNGALFSGPTFNNTIWTDLTRNRDTGSPMWLPIYDEGYNARFVARPENLDRPAKPWDGVRVAYLQHASDPIVWWSPDLLFSKPDWLSEPPGREPGASSERS